MLASLVIELQRLQAAGRAEHDDGVSSLYSGAAFT